MNAVRKARPIGATGGETITGIPECGAKTIADRVAFLPEPVSASESPDH
jgi:hypothetical protein